MGERTGGAVYKGEGTLAAGGVGRGGGRRRMRRTISAYCVLRSTSASQAQRCDGIRWGLGLWSVMSTDCALDARPAMSALEPGQWAGANIGWRCSTGAGHAGLTIDRQVVQAQPRACRAAAGCNCSPQARSIRLSSDICIRKFQWQTGF
jgi:hypothetical protein